jgi:RNA polymerase-binding transcription factor DksA
MPNLDAIRSSLEAERASLVRRLAESEAGGESRDYDEGFADSAQVSAEQGEHRALAASLADQLTEIDQALARLDDGSYGTCIECGEQIGAERLEAMPATRYCINHA